MDKNKITDELKKLLKNKNMNTIFAVLLVIAFMLIAINVFAPKLMNNFGGKQEKVIDEANKTPVTANTSYEDNQKSDLIKILKKINGVGEVDVMITFESGEVKIPAYDTTTQTTTTEETDTSGGKRVNNQKNDGSKVVMTTEGGGNAPFILQTYKPKVIGVVVTAEGAENSKVRYNIEKAVSNLYNLGADKVNVYPMKK